MSYRKIQAETGVSRGTISNIANGKCHYKSASYLSRLKKLEWGPPIDIRIAVKCPTCGAKVYPPCIACRVRRYNRDRQRRLAHGY